MAAQVRTLKNPPIAEALVDFRVAGKALLTAEALKEALRPELRDAYPEAQEQNEAQTQFRIESGKLISEVGNVDFKGLQFKSADGTRIAQFRNDGFTFNQLPPYRGADLVIEEALRLWQLYVRLVTPSHVVRVALRYINRLGLPLAPGEDFERFLTAAPEMPNGTPQSVANFLTRVVVATSERSFAIVTQKLDSAVDQPIPFVLDIDAFVEGEFAPTTDVLFPILTELRAVKNNLFFSFLTEEALRTYE